MPQQLGLMLRDLRLACDHSLRDLELRTGITRGTLSRWESGSFQPRLPELEAVLTALNARPEQRDAALASINAPRSVQELRLKTTLPMGLDSAALPSSGDLLRAMRRRSRLSLQQVAERLGVEHTTVSRWEQSKMAPSIEHRARLFDLVGAQPEEQRVLIEGGFLQTLRMEELPLSEELFLARLERLKGRAWAGHSLLVDLEFFALEAECWRSAQTDFTGRQRLACAYVWHAQWLSWRNRNMESREYANRALDLTPDFPPQTSWIWAPSLAIQPGRARPNPQTFRRGLEYLRSWRPMAILLGRDHFLNSRIAEFAAACHRPDVILDLIGSDYSRFGTNEYFWADRSHEWLWGKALVMSGRPAEALSVLPRDEQPNLHQRVDEHLTWCEALIDLGETSQAQHRYQQARALMDEYDLPFPEADRIARRL